MYTTSANVAWLVLAGAGTGLLGALLGTGGGVFLIPVLVLGFGVPMHHAIATSIVSVVATSSAVAISNVERGTANMRLGMTLELATVLGAIAGVLTSSWIGPRFLEILFALVLLPTALVMWQGRGEEELPAHLVRNGGEPSDLMLQEPGLLGGHYFDSELNRIVYYEVRRLEFGLAVSFIAGNLSGLLGIGGGVFKVPALHLLCGVPMKAAAATSNFMIGVTAAASALLYYGRGDVRPVLTAAVILGVVAGSASGGVINRYVRGKILSQLFASLLVIVAIQMILRPLFSGG